MEHNDNKRHQRFDGVTTYCYNTSKKNKQKKHTNRTELNSDQLEP